MSIQSPIVIAIDGPAASGKSTVARALAEQLDLTFVSSGAMYRAFTWWVLESGADPADSAAVVELLNRSEFECGEENRRGTIMIDGQRLLPEQLSEERVNAEVSTIAAIPEVRSRLVAEQRRYAERSSVVMEGRDIGSVVFPDTPHKFYITASEEVRQARRAAQGIQDRISERDQKDKTRKASPLVVPEDAIVIDSSDLSVAEVVEQAIAKLSK